MYRFAIYYLLPLALLCILFASAQANLEKLKKIKYACLDDGGQVFNGEEQEIFLYRTVYMKAYGNGQSYEIADPMYSIRDGSGKKLNTHDFGIPEYATIVTEEAIIITWLSRKITLHVDGGTFAFYRELFPLPRHNTTHRFPVNHAHGYHYLQNVDGVKTRKVNKFWLFIAAEGSTPHLIFPSNSVVLKPPPDDPDDLASVTFTLKAGTDIPITIQFSNSRAAAEFRRCVTDSHLMIRL